MNKWFKILGISFVVVLVLSTIAGVALAQGPVDPNGDGLCDDFVDEDGDGVCDLHSPTYDGEMTRYGQNDEAWQRGYANGEMPCDDFVDEDGDGVCDLCGAAYEGEMRGPRYGQNDDAQERGYANGEMPSDNFVDEDGDGVCDNDGPVTERLLSGRGSRGGRGNWSQGQGQGLYGQNGS